IMDVAVDGYSVGPVTSYTFNNVSADHVISITFDSPPTLSGVPATASIPEMAPYTFTATATDGDTPAQTLTFSLIGAPAGAAIDPATGVFTWTPSLAQAGASYPFTVRVLDGVTNADAPIALSVTLTVYTITASAGGNGTVSPSGAVSVPRGDSLVVAV